VPGPSYRGEKKRSGRSPFFEAFRALGCANGHRCAPEQVVGPLGVIWLQSVVCAPVIDSGWRSVSIVRAVDKTSATLLHASSWLTPQLSRAPDSWHISDAPRYAADRTRSHEDHINVIGDAALTHTAAKRDPAAI
jgi:hypothetical protein